MTVLNRLTQTLDRVDWSFPGAATPTSSVHSLHWFPGNFIPQVPSYLIQILSAPGQTVCDPFCGSGTTGIEAITLDRRALLSDANRASLQVTSGKLAATYCPRLAKQLRRLEADLAWEGILRTDAFGANGEGADPELRRWFSGGTLDELRYLWSLVERAESPGERKVLELIFADALFDCASLAGETTITGKRRRHHWGWIADNVRPASPIRRNAIALFRRRLAHAAAVIEAAMLAHPGDSLVSRADARDLPVLDSSVDVVITSPPYLGMIDYTRANRLIYLWMGWNLAADLRREIGARYRRDRAGVADEYLTAMAQAFLEIARVLRRSGYCAVIIGASRKYPDVALRVIEGLTAPLEKIWGPVARVPSRRRVSNRLGTFPTEWLAVFVKR